MESIEQNINILLDGGLIEEPQEFCDFSLDEQIEQIASKGIEANKLSNRYIPVVQKSVCYIVLIVLINEDNEVLMMQEAKKSCAGQWYLPAGRMEPGESIIQAAKRELEEETGLDFEPTTLISVESAQGSWYRFVLTGKVVGGSLKTVANADSESLQAKWVDDLNELSLRATDILSIVEKARSFHEHNEEQWHDNLLPVQKAHNKLYLRVVLIIRKRLNNRIHVLVSEKEVPHLPVCEINPIRSIHSTLKRYVQSIFGNEMPPHKPHGILTVEHDGMPCEEHDGLGLTLLVSIKNPLEDVGVINDKYTWLEVSKHLGQKLLSRISKNMAVQFNVVR
ncbi:8-oxo-dGDP phosphatase NUDT18 [Nymphon striatum]|nr:8-oxo-dGDP phosphatase NUDT18 [Nymphon striatum]